LNIAGGASFLSILKRFWMDTWHAAYPCHICPVPGNLNAYRSKKENTQMHWARKLCSLWLAEERMSQGKSFKLNMERKRRDQEERKESALCDSNETHAT
jgi:hypothetical protein